MKNVSLVFLVALFVASLSFSALAQGTQINSCDTDANWTISLPYSGAGESVALEVESTIKQEGAASLKVTYNYAAALPYHEARATFAPAAPIDLSSALKFSFKLYGNAVASNDTLWYVVFRTTTGKQFRYVNWAGLGPTEWQNIEISLRNMEKPPYETASDNPIISKVDQVWFIVQKKDGVTAPGSAVVYIDDIRFYTQDSDTEVTVFENFEYASDAALQAAWTTSAGGAGNSWTATLGTGLDGKAMKLDATVASRYSNFWASYTFSETRDLRGYDFMRLWVKGQDPTTYPSGTSPILMVYFEAPGTSVNRLRAFISQATKEQDWACYLLFLEKCDLIEMGGWPDVTTPFIQDKWDGAQLEYIDFSAISKMHIAFAENALDANYTTTIMVDKIELGRQAPPPTPTPTPAPLGVLKAWNIYE